MRPGSVLLKILVALWMIAAALPARAEIDAWELIHPRAFDWRNAEHRQAVARDLIDRLGLLQGVVPPQSPELKARIEAEMRDLADVDASADAARRGRLYTSRRYQQYRLLELLGEARESLDCVLDAAELDREMQCWGLASLHLGDEAKLDVALGVLRRARMIPRDGKMPVEAQDPVVWYGEYGRGILRYILVPYLSDQVEVPVAGSPP